ncbi:hypothetical protein [Brevundimonas sp.]|uniref:hypothetical protein n=1 Tax=Brevundimonas sp. TaxID=1871086 RepID=UPI002D73D804|nr:hypothetical protein [Brevundimonas sp.]HYC74268.1 hypothetical protein [Brevundimonas sp.]
MMIGMIALFAALLGQDPGGPGERGQVVKTFDPPPRGIARCLRDLPRGREFAVPILCEVNSIGGPTRCEFEPGTPRELRYAAECASRGYDFRWENGKPATGQRVYFTVRMRTL